MNNNSYIFYGTQTEWDANSSNYSFPYIAYTSDAGNHYISAYEGGGGGQEQHNYQTYNINYVWNNLHYLRTDGGDYANIQLRFAAGGGEDQPYNNSSFSYERDGWTLAYNDTDDTLTLSRQVTVDTALAWEEQVSYIQSLGNVQIWGVIASGSEGVTLYNPDGYQLTFNGWTNGGWGSLHQTETITVYDLMVQAGYITNSTLGDVSITQSIADLFSYDEPSVDPADPTAETHTITYTINNMNGVYMGTDEESAEYSVNTSEYQHDMLYLSSHPLMMVCMDANSTADVYEFTLNADINHDFDANTNITYDYATGTLTITVSNIDSTSSNSYNLSIYDGDASFTDAIYNCDGSRLNYNLLTDFTYGVCVINESDAASADVSTTLDFMTERVNVIADYFYIQNNDQSSPYHDVYLRYTQWEGTEPAVINTFDLEWSYDQVTWQTKTFDTTNTEYFRLTMNEGSNIVYLRAPSGSTLSTTGLSDDQYYSYTFACDDADATFTVGGNIMTLLYSVDTGVLIAPDMSIPSNHCFNHLFAGFAVETAQRLWLPSTMLSDFCYNGMFSNCTALTVPPETITVTYDSFNRHVSTHRNMFYGCTSLTYTPDMYVAILDSYQFYNMYYSCQSLATVRLLEYGSNASDAEECMTDWLYDVSPSGVIQTYSTGDLSSLPTDSTSGVPTGWTIEAVM